LQIVTYEVFLFLRRLSMSKKIIFISLLLAAVMLFGACASNQNTQPTNPGASTNTKSRPVVFADIGWDSIRFHNAVVRFIAEEVYGLETEEVSGTTPITYTALLKGDIDVSMEMWTDNLATYKEDLSEGKFKELGINFGDNTQGLYVPRYVIEGDAERGIEPMAPDLKTVEDLKNYPQVFQDPDNPSKGRIYGAISGWDIDTIMRKKCQYYGLTESYNYFDPGSDAALSAAFASAYEKGEPIVGYYWEPTWLLGKYDLVLLDDAPYDAELYPEGKTACPSVEVTVCVSNDFYAAFPEFCEFLSNYKTSSALTSEALSYIQDTKASYEETAIWFLKENDQLISQWLPETKAELLRNELNE
jgi:glycine betaine/proline transport system substrate-binding protein